jgi:glyoxylase-like metal-dependent hydrolase (beta-lactamase superfamily II)
MTTTSDRLTRRRTAADVRLYVIDTGLIECSEFAMFSPSAGPGTYRKLSVRSYLVAHPDGVLLWDTGITDRIAADPAGERVADAILFRVPRTLRSQLDAIGQDDGTDVDLIGLSHMHIDHVGNLEQFPDTRVLMQQAECDAAYGPHAEQLTYIPEAYATLDRRRIHAIVGEHDVFGDGTVVMTPLPGHTPGHQGLLVVLPQTGPVLLAADIAYSAADYADAAVRELNVDLEASRHSIERAKDLERDRGATVWLHHDLEAQRDVRTAPSFYT